MNKPIKQEIISSKFISDEFSDSNSQNDSSSMEVNQMDVFEKVEEVESESMTDSEDEINRI